MTADEAWKLYQNRGVIIPEYAGEIAERRRLTAEWDDAHQSLR